MFRVENLTNSKKAIYVRSNEQKDADGWLLIDGEPYTAETRYNTVVAGGIEYFQMWTINETSGNAGLAQPIDDNAKTAEFTSEFYICDKFGKELTKFMLPAIDLMSPARFPYATTAPIPDLTDEEAKREIELLGMTLNPDTEIPVAYMFIIICSGLNEKGEVNNYIEFVYLGTKRSSNTGIISTLWNQNYIFEFPDNGADTINPMLDGVLVAPLYESLYGVELEQLSTLPNLERLCKQYGISVKTVNTQIGKEIAAFQAIGWEEGLAFTYEEYADYYVRAFAKENRMSAADYTNPIPYTPRTPAP